MTGATVVVGVFFWVGEVGCDGRIGREPEEELSMGSSSMIVAFSGCCPGKFRASNDLRNENPRSRVRGDVGDLTDGVLWGSCAVERGDSGLCGDFCSIDDVAVSLLTSRASLRVSRDRLGVTETFRACTVPGAA